jgi:hypothetical protein
MWRSLASMRACFGASSSVRRKYACHSCVPGFSRTYGVVKTTCSEPPGISLKRQIGISIRRALRESREFSPSRRVFAIGGASGDGAHPLSLNRHRILYAVKADGQRFLVNLPVGQDTSSPITVVLNWTAGLKK